MYYFDKFPKIQYDISGKQLSNYQTVTNIFFRVNFIREALQDSTTYYYHIIADSERPEIIAETLYGNPEAHWVVLMANNIVDPFYDWPLSYSNFTKYIRGKYGSVATAKTTVHHYEKVIRREESFSGTVSETRFRINHDKLTVNGLDVPYDYYENLEETQAVNTYDMGEGRTVIETINRESISVYDYEDSLNEAKRTIKLIKPAYYNQIVSEFDNLTGNITQPWLRKLK